MRNTGTFDYPSNFEVKRTAPLDARILVESYADLVKASTWQDKDKRTYLYKGLTVSCQDKQGKLYQLIADDYTQESSWKEIGGGVDSTADIECNSVTANSHLTVGDTITLGSTVIDEATLKNLLEWYEKQTLTPETELYCTDTNGDTQGLYYSNANDELTGVYINVN